MAKTECRWESPNQWSEWVEWLAAGLHARNRWRLPVILLGMLFANGRRTVTTWLRAAGVSNEFDDYYYSQAWHVLKTRKDADTDPLSQYVWHPYYVDALAVRYYDSDTDGASIATHYYCQDANFNVIAVMDNTGSVLERYQYDPYGQATILDADFSDDADGASDIENPYTSTGRRNDNESGLYYYRNRYYDGSLGRFITRDPIGFRL